MSVLDRLVFVAILSVHLGCGARSGSSDPASDAAPETISWPDAALPGVPDAGLVEVPDAAHPAVEEAATSYCEAACAADPPICEEGFRGNTCFDHCWMLYVWEAHENDPANPCNLGLVDLLRCLAANPGACEKSNPACGNQWQLLYYCAGG